MKVRQVFRNQTDGQVEGTFIFPLPPDAAISDFQMTVDGQVLEGKVMKKDEARRIYEDIVRSQRDPALLEYVGRDLFQTNVFPIPPGAAARSTSPTPRCWAGERPLPFPLPAAHAAVRRRPCPDPGAAGRATQPAGTAHGVQPQS